MHRSISDCYYSAWSTCGDIYCTYRRTDDIVTPRMVQKVAGKLRIVLAYLCSSSIFAIFSLLIADLVVSTHTTLRFVAHELYFCKCKRNMDFVIVFCACFYVVACWICMTSINVCVNCLLLRLPCVIEREQLIMTKRVSNRAGLSAVGQGGYSRGSPILGARNCRSLRPTSCRDNL